MYEKNRTVGDEIIQGLNDAMAHQAGKITLKTTTVKIPDLPSPISNKKRIFR